jgi:hypothetical protein
LFVYKPSDATKLDGGFNFNQPELEKVIGPSPLEFTAPIP